MYIRLLLYINKSITRFFLSVLFVYNIFWHSFPILHLTAVNVTKQRACLCFDFKRVIVLAIIYYIYFIFFQKDLKNIK